MIPGSIRIFRVTLCIAILLLFSIHLNGREIPDANSLSLDGLDASGAMQRAEAEYRVRAELNAQNLLELIRTFDRLPPSLQQILARIVSSGGPWLPGLIQALEVDSPSAALAGEWLEKALENRMSAPDLPDPGHSATDQIDPFGNVLTREGKALLFNGVWPESMPLHRLLERINEEALPSRPLVLHPGLADAARLLIERPPMAGPAPLVLERLLASLELGVTYLESLVLVEPEGGAMHPVYPSDLKNDRYLLRAVIACLADPGATETSRQAAFRALSYLDLPGLFQGYLIELGRGKPGECLHALLHGPFFARLCAVLGTGGNPEALETLVRLYCGESCDAHIQERIDRLFLHLAPDRLWPVVQKLGLAEEDRALVFRARAGHLETEALLIRLRGPDPEARHAGLRAAEWLADAGTDFKKPLLDILQAWPAEASQDRRRVDRILRRGFFRCLSDTELASLLRQPQTRWTALALVENQGGSATLQALLAWIHSESGCTWETIHCTARLGAFLGEPSLARYPLRSNLHPGTIIARAGLLAAWPDKPGRDRAAAALLCGMIRKGGPLASQAAGMFRFFTGGRIIPHLPALLSALESAGEPARIALEEAILHATNSSSLSAERIRLALEKLGDQGNWPRLDRDLALLAGLTSFDSWRVTVDI